MPGARKTTLHERRRSITNTLKTLITIGLSASLASSAIAGDDVCFKTAESWLQSAAFEIKEEFKEARAVCANITDPEEQAERLLEALLDR